MAIHSSTLAWETPWTEEPGGLPSMGSQIGPQLSGCAHMHLVPPVIPQNSHKLSLLQQLKDS